MIGTRLGSWKIDRLIGRGGMGNVYLAHREPSPPGEPPELAAVKLLAPELAVESGFVQRFQREINILRQLTHPNIVRFLEAGQQDTHSWFVMEYIDGPSYEALREERGKLPWQEVLELGLQIAPALKHAHDRGVIHRDIKPANLLRPPDDPAQPDGPVVKLTDFGIASLFASPHLTVTGGVVGTAEYLSPEQAMGKAATRRSDLYSLGVVLYTLVTGRTPFEGEVTDLLHKHRYAQLEQPIRLVPEIPHEFNDIICQLLEKDPERRPGDAAVLHRQLDSFRRRHDYRTAQAEQPTQLTRPADRRGEGPATLMSRLMRQELEQSRRGGPVQQFFNRPAVLLPLFLLTVGLILWSFWPLSSETKFQRGLALMNSANPDDWASGWEKYLQPLYEDEPDNPHREELEQLRRRYEKRQAELQAQTRAAQLGKYAGLTSEAHWFYQQGLRLRQKNDEEGARKCWQALIAAFGDVPSEGPWVVLARQELDRPPEEAKGTRKLDAVREAARRVRELRKEGQADQANAILAALHRLYEGDAEARAIIDEK